MGEETRKGAGCGRRGRDGSRIRGTAVKLCGCRWIRFEWSPLGGKYGCSPGDNRMSPDCPLVREITGGQEFLRPISIFNIPHGSRAGDLNMIRDKHLALTLRRNALILGRGSRDSEKLTVLDLVDIQSRGGGRIVSLEIATIPNWKTLWHGSCSRVIEGVES